MRLAVVALCGLPAACIISGCQTAPSAPPVPRVATANLLYSPVLPEMTALDAPRAPWPTSYRSGPSHEIVEYRSRLIDQQNPHSRNNDYLYRRYEEIRSSQFVR